MQDQVRVICPLRMRNALTFYRHQTDHLVNLFQLIFLIANYGEDGVTSKVM
jgi:hypothetical protein